MTKLFGLIVLRFLGTLVISAVVFVFTAGAFTLYFGRGRTRMGGAIMIVLSIALFAAFYVLVRLIAPNFSIVLEILEPALFFLLAMAIGAVIGLLIFLAILVKT